MPSKIANTSYFPHLDALRFFAFFGVFLHHSFFTKYEDIAQHPLFFWTNKIFTFGELGVNFFFVLSGFLITFLLLKEEEKQGKIDIKAFYVRRFLRIWPLYYACLFFCFVIYPAMTGKTDGNPWYYIFFLGNFDSAFHGLPQTPILSVLWSIAVEEQFYLIWPLLIAFVPKKYRMYIFFVIIALSTAFKFHYFERERFIRVHTLGAISDMAMGGLMAWIAYNYNFFAEKLEQMTKSTIILTYVLLLGVVVGLYNIHHPLAIAVYPLVLAVLFGFVIAEQNFATNSVIKWGNFAFLDKWGKYTYGLYCLHYIGIYIVTIATRYQQLNHQMWVVMLLEPLLSLGIAFGVSYLSFHYFESYFLKLKNKFSRI